MTQHKKLVFCKIGLLKIIAKKHLYLAQSSGRGHIGIKTYIKLHLNFYVKCNVMVSNSQIFGQAPFPKGQTNSKADVSSKKRTNKFDFTTSRLVLFLEESEDPKKTFRN